MEIIKDLNGFEPLRNSFGLSLALGFFDGVHLAHRKLIESATRYAKENSLKSGVITFSKAPFEYIFKKEPLYITNFSKKAELIESLGADYLFVLDFEEFYSMEAKFYIENFLIKKLGAKFVTTGFNHTFGKNKKGNPETLKKYGNYFKYVEIPPVEIENKLVSSTNIREEIKKGNFEIVNKMLKRNFSIKGEVIKGNQIARKLGKNTANIIWEKEIVKPPYGVYFGEVTVKGKKRNALINFGIRPSVDKNLKETLEVHILDFEGDLYGSFLEVEFIKKIRSEIKFNSLNELKNQIDKDYEIVQALIKG